MAITATASSRTNQNRNQTEREPSPFDGFWINVGIYIKHPDTGEEMFIRVSQGVSVAALQKTVITKRTSPEFALQAGMANRLTASIEAACKNMKEGEYRPLDALSVSLYRQGEPLEEIYDDEELFDVFGKTQEPLKLVGSNGDKDEPPFDND